MNNTACLINKVYLVNKIYQLLGPTTVHSNICLASLLFLTLLSFSCLDKLNHTKKCDIQKKEEKNVIFYITIKGSGKLPVSLRTVFMVSMYVCAPQACLVPAEVIEGPDSLGLEAQGHYCEG